MFDMPGLILPIALVKMPVDNEELIMMEILCYEQSDMMEILYNEQSDMTKIQYD